MKANWKSMFIWSSLGGLALGATVSLARKSRKPARPPLVYKEIPDNCQRIILRTERFEIEGEGGKSPAHDEYLLQPTQFKVWSVIDLPATRGDTNPQGDPIYHVSFVRRIEVSYGETAREEARAQERFYGTVRTLNAEGDSRGSGYLARGGILEIRKCYVGGASNGIETGEVHRSRRPILNYRYEYSND